jgi:uncharacterized LabA/DUF88 family protein
MRTIVYVDGFNLYFRILRRYPACKWLDLKQLATALLSQNNDIIAVKYYTARVSGRLDADAPRRQQIYWDALYSIPEISIHKGMFLTSEKWSGLVHPPEFLPNLSIDKPWPDVVKVLKVEEKGSDVNLASHILFDAFRDKYDVAVVLSNDSDLVEPIRIVTQELRKTVGLLSPVRSPNPELEAVSSFIKRIRRKHLLSSQFENPLKLQDGTLLNMPDEWSTI